MFAANHFCKWINRNPFILGNRKQNKSPKILFTVQKKVLGMAGVTDVWSATSGGSNTYNMAMATIRALDALNTLKPAPE